jgi:hypothetical protein
MGESRIDVSKEQIRHSARAGIVELGFGRREVDEPVQGDSKGWPVPPYQRALGVRSRNLRTWQVASAES